MKKWTSYAIICAIFFSVNVLLLFIRSASWDLVQSLTITAVFLLFLLTLDGIAALLKRRNSRKY